MAEYSQSLLSKVRHAEGRKFIPDYIYSGLAALGCTEPEIANLLQVPKDSLAHKADLMQSGRARLKQSLRKAQLKLALKGNASMLIWLGKTYLGQSENPSPSLSQQTNIVVDASLLSALQSSYKDTLQDIRNAKDLPPASDPIAKPRGNPNWRKGYTPAIALSRSNVPRGTNIPTQPNSIPTQPHTNSSHPHKPALDTESDAHSLGELVTPDTPDSLPMESTTTTSV